VASVLAGGALLVLSTFVPFSILRLIPMVEAGAIGHLEGVRQRGAAAVTRLPRSAAQLALSEGMAAHGAAKLAAQAGPPGTAERGGLGFGGQKVGTAADCNPSNGGLVPDADGMMIGLPVDEEALRERFWGEPKPKGPNPILAVPSKAAAAGADDTAVAPRMQIIGKPGPHDRRYALGRDDIGPVIHGLPPLRPRPRPESPPAPESS
jgi:hypothetical protein